MSDWDDFDEPMSAAAEAPVGLNHQPVPGRSFRGRGRGRVPLFNPYEVSSEPQTGGNSYHGSSASSSASSSIFISSRSVGRVIGKGGSTIRDIESRSGARVNICKDSNGPETRIEISGSADCQSKAKSIIQELTSDNRERSYNSNWKNERSYDQSDEYNKRSKVQSTDSTFDDSAWSWEGVPVGDNFGKAKEEPKDEFIECDWDAVLAESDRATKAKWEALGPIIKNFYIESPEVANMTEEEVRKFREENNNITISHLNEDDQRPLLRPIVKFEDAFSAFPEILDEIKKNNFEKPSPIQSQSWPVLLSGYDLIGIAQTGSGKTLAYLLPAMIHIDNQTTPRDERPGPTALIIAPTRELAQQIEKEAKKYSYRNIRTVCLYGGGDRKAQIEMCEAGIEIVIATPGRLTDLYSCKKISLDFVSYIVLDEADRMLDMGFEPEVRAFMNSANPNRQNVFMSATWPEHVRALAKSFTKDAFQVYVNTLDLAACTTVDQEIVMIDETKKCEYLFNFVRQLQPSEKMIVFAGKKASVDYLASEMSLKGMKVVPMHGGLEQSSREEALQSLKDGFYNVLIATDVASRGLDIDDITHIFNFDFPRDIEEYVHRIGRTGRAGKSGKSITLVCRDDWKHAEKLIEILERASQHVPQQLRDMAARYKVWLENKEAERAERAAALGVKPGRHFGLRPRW